MRSFVALVLAGTCLVACGSGGGAPSLLVGTAGPGDMPGTFTNTGHTMDAGAVSAHIESPPGVTVTFVALSCTERCADVLVVAKGGFPPYTYRWEDGSTDPSRHVCPTASTSYRVSVTDSGSVTGELPVPPETVTAPLTAKVVACGDAGAIDGSAKACGAGFKPSVYEGSFKQASGVLAGTHTLVLSKTAAATGLETITGKLDAVLTDSVTTSTVTWGEGSTFDCTTQRLFLTGVRTDSPIMIPYTYEATYDPANGTVSGRWAAAAPPSPGVFPMTAIDSGTWDAHWVRP